MGSGFFEKNNNKGEKKVTQCELDDNWAKFLKPLLYKGIEPWLMKEDRKSASFS